MALIALAASLAPLAACSDDEQGSTGELCAALADVPDGDATAAVAVVHATTEAHPDVQAAADELEAFTVDSC